MAPIEVKKICCSESVLVCDDRGMVARGAESVGTFRGMLRPRCFEWLSVTACDLGMDDECRVYERQGMDEVALGYACMSRSVSRSVDERCWTRKVEADVRSRGWLCRYAHPSFTRQPRTRQRPARQR